MISRASPSDFAKLPGLPGQGMRRIFHVLYLVYHKTRIIAHLRLVVDDSQISFSLPVRTED